MRKIILENEEIKHKKEQQQKEARKQMARVQQENLEKLKQKEAKRLKEQEDEMKLMKQYDKMLEERAARREARVVAQVLRWRLGMVTHKVGKAWVKTWEWEVIWVWVQGITHYSAEQYGYGLWV